MPSISIIDARSQDPPRLQKLCERTLDQISPQMEGTVREIVGDVRERGDEALVEYTRRFDCADFEAEQIRIRDDEIQAAYDAVDAGWLAAFRRARENVRQFQERARNQSWLESFDGLQMGHHVTPVGSAGIYVPARAAPLPSSLLMSAIPAQVAGVETIVFVTPPREDGSVDPTMLVAARECDVDAAYRIGGAQAVAAMAFGTETVQRVAKIVGPGSSWTSIAKKYVFGVVGIDSMAGPSESLIIADASAQVELVAADLLSQAEHTGDNIVILLTDSEAVGRDVQREVEGQVEKLERSELTRASLADHSFIVLVRDLRQAVEISNEIAPEHLQILIEEPFELLEQVTNAGCIFLGDRTPVPLGDYAAGPSHVLPTYGTARFSEALSVNDFLVVSSVIHADEKGFARLADDVIQLADHEGLTAHSEAVRRRMRSEGD